jgi:predicted ABC-type transport system involved in lysophospholipase L1 biosynthesis ATPase subunit
MSEPDSPAGRSEFALEARELHRSFAMGRREVRVLQGVSLRVRAGEALCVMGASGAGKSTLLHILGGLDRPTRGAVVLQGLDLYALAPGARSEIRARRLGFVFQAYHLLPELDLAENVALPAMSRWGATRRSAEHRARATGLLDRVGLRDRAAHRPTELSGGEQQRAALARALMNDPEIVFADEPTGNLDSDTGAQVLDSLFELVRERRHTLVLVTHNQEVARRCDRVLLLKDGVLA